MEKFKSILSKIKYYRVICILVSLVSLIIGIVMSIVLSAGSNKYQDQTAAKRWDKKGDHAHISYFFKENAYFTQTEVDGFVYNLEDSLDKNSIVKENEDSRRYIYCYEAKSTITLEGPHEILDVNCIAAGGDFFFFHPVKMINGSYFDGDDLMNDGIILDEEAAWKLFGSNDIEGMQVMYGDRVLYVRGVYEREENKLYDYARGKDPEIFVPFSLLDSTEMPLNITCLEVVMPNPVDNFAAEQMTDIIKLDTSVFEMVENSKRYSVGSLWNVYKNRRYRSMQNHDIIYPYWEKIARYEEDVLAPKAIIMVVSYVVSGTVFISLILYELTKLTKLKSRNDDN